MSDAMRALTMIIPGFLVGGVGTFIAWRHIGGWRGFRTPRILIPLLIALLGLVMSITASAMMREKVPGEPWVPNPSWMGTTVFVGLGLFMVGFFVGTTWTTFRYVRLVRVMQRLDAYVQGSEPFPLPEADTAVRRNVGLAARLLADPALSHAMDPLVVERVGDLHAGRVARPLPASRG